MQIVNVQPSIIYDDNMQSRCAEARANVNIALIKYWGKRDENLIIPYTSSLSLTLADWGTKTRVSFDEDLSEDCVSLDGVKLANDESNKVRNRIVSTLDLIRKRAGISTKARVDSHNSVPTAAGLASSASGFAALTAAGAYAAGLDLSARELSRLARRGSGSACRSIFGGLVVWHAGEDDESSYAEPIDMPENLELAMIAIVLNPGSKPISSREAMRRTVETSPTYMPWVNQSEKDFQNAICAIKNSDIEALGSIVESNFAGMHETMHNAVPAINYLTEESYKVLNIVKSLRSEGLPAWATMDAGPNVKVLTVKSQAQKVADELRSRISQDLGDLRMRTSEKYSSSEDSSREAISREAIRIMIALPGDSVSVSTSK